MKRRARVSRAVAGSVIGGAALLAMAAGPATAASIDVFVGYADNLRPSGFFPTPWLGDANVVSETPTGQSHDSGAIRIDNNTGAAITISNFSVALNGGANTFNIWSSLVIGAGQTGIFTQTFSYNFDSSDYGTFGGLPPASLAPANGSEIGGCSSSAAAIAAAGFTAQCNANIPVVSFSVNGGAVQSFNDTGHILDTGQWDFVNNGVFGGDGNESINWNRIGSTPVRGGNGVPEPASLALLGSALAGFAALRRRRWA